MCRYVMLLVSVAVLDMPETSLSPTIPFFFFFFLFPFVSCLSSFNIFFLVFACLSVWRKLTTASISWAGLEDCTCHCNSELHRGWI